jgi:hypothetical protein
VFALKWGGWDLHKRPEDYEDSRPKPVRLSVSSGRGLSAVRRILSCSDNDQRRRSPRSTSYPLGGPIGAINTVGGDQAADVRQLTTESDHEGYRWLNDLVCLAEGLISAAMGGDGDQRLRRYSRGEVSAVSAVRRSSHPQIR